MLKKLVISCVAYLPPNFRFLPDNFFFLVVGGSHVWLQCDAGRSEQ